MTRGRDRGCGRGQKCLKYNVEAPLSVRLIKVSERKVHYLQGWNRVNYNMEILHLECRDI